MNTPDQKPVKVVVTKPWTLVLGELVVAAVILFVFWRLIGSPSFDDMLVQARGFVDFLGTNPTPAP